MSKQQIRFIKGGITDYNNAKMQGAIYFAEDKKKIIVDGAEYGLDLESDEVDLISNIEHKDNSVKSVLMIGGGNGKTNGIKPVDKNENAKLILNNNITSIESNAFVGCSGFTSLKLPENLTSIKPYAFYYCEGFTGELIIPESVTSIGSEAFGSCSGFTSLKLPENLTSIGEWAFSSCSGFTGDLILPEGLTSIGYSAFSGCSGLSKIYVCEDTELGNGWNNNTPAEVIKYKKGETPWLTEKK